MAYEETNEDVEKLNDVVADMKKYVDANKKLNKEQTQEVLVKSYYVFVWNTTNESIKTANKVCNLLNDLQKQNSNIKKQEFISQELIEFDDTEKGYANLINTMKCLRETLTFLSKELENYDDYKEAVENMYSLSKAVDNLSEAFMKMIKGDTEENKEE